MCNIAGKPEDDSGEPALLILETSLQTTILRPTFTLSLVFQMHLNKRLQRRVPPAQLARLRLASLARLEPRHARTKPVHIEHPREHKQQAAPVGDRRWRLVGAALGAGRIGASVCTPSALHDSASIK
jgi:hypothetical protein